MTILTKLMTPDSRPKRNSKTSSNTYRAVAEAIGSLSQYQEVPQRLKKQWITALMAALTLISIIGGLYLNVTSRTAIAGREIQYLQSMITDTQRANEDLQTQIATLLSSESLRSRAIANGYVPLKGSDLEYITLPGYFPQQGVTLVKPAVQNDDILMSPEYSESLFSWLSRQIEAASLPLAQEQ